MRLSEYYHDCTATSYLCEQVVPVDVSNHDPLSACLSPGLLCRSVLPSLVCSLSLNQSLVVQSGNTSCHGRRHVFCALLLFLVATSGALPPDLFIQSNFSSQGRDLGKSDMASLLTTGFNDTLLATFAGRIPVDMSWTPDGR